MSFIILFAFLLVSTTPGQGSHKKFALFEFLSANKNTISETVASPSGNISRVADGFTWAENLYFDGLGNLWVTDAVTGELYRITRPGGRGTNATKELWASVGFSRLLGISSIPQGVPSLYLNGICVVARLTNGSMGIIIVDTTVPQQWYLYSETLVLGNGLAALMNQTSRSSTAAPWPLFTTNEGEFIPSWGRVMAVLPGFSVNLETHLTAADGAFLDYTPSGDALLYVSDVTQAFVYVWNVSMNAQVTATLLTNFTAPGMKMLDDFCISRTAFSNNSPYFFGADFWAGSVLFFRADRPQLGSQVIATGLLNPTSVRRGEGPGWKERPGEPVSVFVTEGGGFIPAVQKNRGVWEILLDSSPPF